MLRASFFLATFAIGGCGGTVATSESGGTTSGAGGATTSASATVAASSGSASGSSSGASSSASSGAGGGCGTLTVTEDGGPAQVFASDCAGTTWDGHIPVAVGWYSGNPAQNTGELEIVACKSDAAGAEGLVLTLVHAMMQPASYTAGTAQLTTGQGETWTNASGKVVYPVDVTVTASEGYITGTFSVTVFDTTQTKHTLTGAFDVCRPPISFPPGG